MQGIKWDGKSPFIPKAAADVAALQQMMNTAMNLKIDKMFDWKKVEARMFETLGMDVSSVLENPAAWLDEYEAERGKIL